MPRVHKAELLFVRISICEAVKRGECKRPLSGGEAQSLDGGDADTDARKRAGSHHAGKEVARLRRQLCLLESGVDFVHQDHGVPHRAVGTGQNDLPLAMDGDGIELSAARIDGKKVHVTISRSSSLTFRMTTFLQSAGSSPAMFSLHSIRQIFPASK